MTSAAGYFSDTKPVLLELVDPAGMRVLDAGCGAGGNAALMKGAGAGEIVGIELHAVAAQRARAVCDRVLEGDLSDLDLEALGAESFDLVLAIDVLEHLAAPEEALRRLVGLLRPGGILVACIPNVAHVWVFANLLAQTWPQKDSGIFDRTHRRFFARRDMIRLLEGAGLEISTVRPYFTRHRSLQILSLAASLYVFRNFWARQFLLVGRRPS
jgi:2-polyprenyl-3-methyl-5-hydroxy-6-metoxy-1,4-benzoquinol methylase